jgi:hypothetical protein
MTTSHAATVAEYLRLLPPDRRRVLEAVRRIVIDHLQDGYEEVMNWGMITYQVPLQSGSRPTKGQPLMYAALASQKNYFVLHLMGVHGCPTELERIADAYKKAGRKLDMGKGCLRFKALDELPVDAIGSVIAAFSPAEFASFCDRARALSRPTRKTS